MIYSLVPIFGSLTKAQEMVLLMAGEKKVVRQGFFDHELRAVEHFCQSEGIFCTLSKFKVILHGDGYSDKGERVALSDERTGVRFAYFSKSERLSLLAAYHEISGDASSLGLLLGYPSCCVEYFCSNFHSQNVDLSQESSLLWTNLSKRQDDCVFLSHFPCSATCRESIALAQKYYSIIAKVDGRRALEMKRMLEN